MQEDNTSATNFKSILQSHLRVPMKTHYIASQWYYNLTLVVWHVTGSHSLLGLEKKPAPFMEFDRLMLVG